jgi:hypothetical protein
MALPFWLRPFIPLLFLAVPWGAACGIHMTLVGSFEACQTHPGTVRIVMAVLLMPIWWLVIVTPDWASRRLALLTWSHLVFQWLGLAGALPLAGLAARIITRESSEKLLGILFLLLLPVSVYLFGSFWLYIARYFASRDEMLRVTQVWTRFDCWLFDRIVGKKDKMPGNLCARQRNFKCDNEP